MIGLFRCLLRFRWCHRLGWPRGKHQTCQDCGRRFRQLVRFPVDKRFRKKAVGGKVTEMRVRKERHV